MRLNAKNKISPEEIQSALAFLLIHRHMSFSYAKSIFEFRRIILAHMRKTIGGVVKTLESMV